MSLLGIDVGTTGCKAAAFSTGGKLLALAYREYDATSPQPGYAELDAAKVWGEIRAAIRETVAQASADPPVALAVASLGEAVVPVSEDRRILGPALLRFDARGAEYLDKLSSALDDDALYRIAGNTLGNQYGLTKLMWIRDHQPALYEQTYKFLPWSGFVGFMLGAEPVTDYSLANTTLLFNLDRETWSAELLALAGLEEDKLPNTARAGQVIGEVSSDMADELGLPAGVAVVSGAHDQCANALGCGVLRDGQAMLALGTHTCVVPVFGGRRDPGVMIPRELLTEHHAVSGKYVCVICTLGGALVKWFRDTFAAAEHREAQQAETDIYHVLMEEMPEQPSGVMVLPHFAAIGSSDSTTTPGAAIAGLKLETSRGEVLKGILEGTAFYLRDRVDTLPAAGIEISDFRVVGGGAKSDKWVQVCSNIMGRPCIRPQTTEAGSLGTAILAGLGKGLFASPDEAVAAMVSIDRAFEPDRQRQRTYDGRFERYKQLGALLSESV